jgi:hypothetical protein
MVSVEAIKQWINSEIYVNLLEQSRKHLTIHVVEKDIPDVVLQFDADNLKLANLSISAIENLAKNPRLVCNYIAQKLKLLSGSGHEEEGKHSEDEESVLIEEIGFYRSFINLYLIELYFLQFDQDGLEAYLKATRVPGAKKYGAQLKLIYSTLMLREELIELVEKIQRSEGAEDEADHDIDFLYNSVADPQAANYIFQEDLSAEEIADRILDYRSIQL